MAAFIFSFSSFGCGSGSGDLCEGPDCPDDGGTTTATTTSTTGGESICGNSLIENGEECDDGNTEDDDGCAADCLEIEDGFVCPDPGEECLVDAVCGNGEIDGAEACDDGNRVSGDGCAAFCNEIEADYYDCSITGQPCESLLECGDGIVHDTEQCDDGNTDNDDGCNERCKLEDGFKCPEGGEECEPTICGDGIIEGTEQCEDQNNNTGDGCSPYLCKFEPVCDRDGICTPRCGDGIKLPQEDCDDGNIEDGDGCSSACEVEEGFECVDMTPEPPETIEAPIVLRDFVGWDCRPEANNNNCSSVAAHIDFQRVNNSDNNMVETMLGADGKPVYRSARSIDSTESFNKWYNDVPDDGATPGANMTFVETLTFNRKADGSYEFDDSTFFPLTDRGFNAIDGDPPPDYGRNGGNNFHFTSEVRYWFQYAGGEELLFRGDDDVWVFINGRLAVDIGGVHGARSDSITLNNGARDVDGNKLGSADTPNGLVVGNIYEAVVFQAERHVTSSNYRLTLRGFNAPRTTCEFICGDGIVTPQEACDDGVNDGSYGSCVPGCLGPAGFCGDGETQAEEECDFRDPGVGRCTGECKLALGCGDGTLNREEGEQCDDGNTEDGDGCDRNCRSEGSILE